MFEWTPTEWICYVTAYLCFSFAFAILVAELIRVGQGGDDEG